MFENLTDKLERSFKVLKGEGRITEINVAESLKEIRRALIDADVNYKVAKTFTDEVKAKALGQDVLRWVKPGQMMTKIVRDELAALMGGTMTDIRLEGSPAVVLIAGTAGFRQDDFFGQAGQSDQKQERTAGAARGGGRLSSGGHRPAEDFGAAGRCRGLYRGRKPQSGADRRERGPLCPGESYQYGDRRYGGPFGRRRADDAGDRGDQAGRFAERDAVRRRLDDRSGRRQHGQTVQRPARLRRRRADEARRRYAGRCGYLDPRGGQQAAEVHQLGREDGRAAGVPPRAHGRPDSRHGRHRVSSSRGRRSSTTNRRRAG